MRRIRAAVRRRTAPICLRRRARPAEPSTGRVTWPRPVRAMRWVVRRTVSRRLARFATAPSTDRVMRPTSVVARRRRVRRATSQQGRPAALRLLAGATWQRVARGIRPAFRPISSCQLAPSAAPRTECVTRPKHVTEARTAHRMALHRRARSVVQRGARAMRPNSARVFHAIARLMGCYRLAWCAVQLRAPAMWPRTVTGLPSSARPIRCSQQERSAIGRVEEFPTATGSLVFVCRSNRASVQWETSACLGDPMRPLGPASMTSTSVATVGRVRGQTYAVSSAILGARSCPST